MKSKYYFFIALFLATQALSAEINVISVSASGFGQTEAEAISEALIQLKPLIDFSDEQI